LSLRHLHTPLLECNPAADLESRSYLIDEPATKLQHRSAPLEFPTWKELPTMTWS